VERICSNFILHIMIFREAVRKQEAEKISTIFNELQSIMPKHKLNDIEVLLMF